MLGGLPRACRAVHRVEQPAKIVERRDAGDGLVHRPHRCTRNGIQHPLRDKGAHRIGAIDAYAPDSVAYLVMDKDLTSVQRMPRIR